VIGSGATARRFVGGLALFCLASALACGGHEVQSPTGPTVPRAELEDTTAPLVDVAAIPEPDPAVVPPSAPLPASGPSAVLIGAGDLAQCGLEGVVRTGQLLGRLLQQGDATVATFGDNSNDNGSKQQYECFDRWWGSYRNLVMPSPGNHDYETAPSSPYYFDYFPNAGPRGLGYYSYDRGAWHIVSLNSELEESLRPAQVSWLEGDLATHRTDCTLAYFHRPLFSSGEFAAQRMKKFWDVLYRYGVDVVVNGHEHMYAAFPPLTPDGSPDARFGIRQFVAGTGGARLFATPPSTYGERIIGQQWGLIKFELRPGDYSWDFVGVDDSILDHGEASCHAQPPLLKP
jgi:hypothetical protein